MKRYLPVVSMIAALVLASCGGHRSAGIPIQQETSRPSAQQAIAELDALACPDGVDTALWGELKEALEAALTESGSAGVPPVIEADGGRDARPTKSISTPPTGEANRVNDLGITDNGDGSYTLTWRYRNLGDYGQDGVVGISDITPLAQHFGETYDIETEPNSLQAVIDGSGNGKVDIADVTPIARHFGTEVADYLIEGATALEGPFSEVGTVSMDSATGAETDRAVFTDASTPGEYAYFRVTPRDGAGTPGEPSNTVGIALQILSVTPTEVKEGTVVTFSAEVLGAGPLEFAWDFGGGAQYETYTEPSPRVVLTRETGEFPASLTVTSPTGADTYPFTLSKLAREWKYEVVLSTDKENEDVGIRGGLPEHHGTLYFYAYINDLEAITTVARYLISGSPGNWEFESDMPAGILQLRLNSEGILSSLSATGSFMNLSLMLREKTNGWWSSETIVTGLSLPGQDFSYAYNDVPFVAYIYRYSAPEVTVELRYARRVDGEWLYGVIDDAGGPGGEVQAPIIMRVDPAGNPAVGYFVKAANESTWEPRVRRWVSSTGHWDTLVLPRFFSDFAYAPDGSLSYVFYGSSGSQGVWIASYGRLNDETWDETVFAEWILGEEPGVSRVRLGYDPLGNAVIIYLQRGTWPEPNVRLRWSSGDDWSVIQPSIPYAHPGSEGVDFYFIISPEGAPYLLYTGHDQKEVILAWYE